VPYLSALEVRSREGAIQIHVYLYLYLYHVLCRVDIYYGSPRVLLSLEEVIESMSIHIVILMNVSG